MFESPRYVLNSIRSSRFWMQASVEWSVGWSVQLQLPRGRRALLRVHRMIDDRWLCWLAMRIGQDIGLASFRPMLPVLFGITLGTLLSTFGELPFLGNGHFAPQSMPLLTSAQKAASLSPAHMWQSINQNPCFDSQINAITHSAQCYLNDKCPFGQLASITITLIRLL